MATYSRVKTVLFLLLVVTGISGSAQYFDLDTRRAIEKEEKIRYQVRKDLERNERGGYTGFNVVGGGQRNRFEHFASEGAEDQARKAAVAAAFVAGVAAMAAARQEETQPDQQESQSTDEGRSAEEVFDSIKKLPPIAFVFGCLIVAGLFKKIFG